MNTSKNESQNIESSKAVQMQEQTTEPEKTILQVAQSQNNPSQVLVPVKSKYCSGNAGCLSGKVTGIVDGDTIDVDGQSIRFALASTPEMNTPMGKAAKQFVLQTCPLGSKVTVDVDDGQTQGSYDRIVGVVYCNGVNLNQAVIEQGYGHLSFSYCDKSEFAGKTWSGCGTSEQKSSYTTSSNCDPNYSGVCIPKGSRDLDCADIGGSVRVSGDDPHGLDRDGDGIGCE